MAKKVGDLKRGVPIWNGDKTHLMKGKVHPNRKVILVFENGTTVEYMSCSTLKTPNIQIN